MDPARNGFSNAVHSLKVYSKIFDKEKNNKCREVEVHLEVEYAQIKPAAEIDDLQEVCETLYPDSSAGE